MASNTARVSLSTSGFTVGCGRLRAGTDSGRRMPNRMRTSTAPSKNTPMPAVAAQWRTVRSHSFVFGLSLVMTARYFGRPLASSTGAPPDLTGSTNPRADPFGFASP
jgi:hypothetical protein